LRGLYAFSAIFIKFLLSLMISQIGNATQSVNGRHMAAALGLVSRQHSMGGKPSLLGISKRSDKNLRRLLMQGTRAVLIQREKHHDALREWIQRVKQSFGSLTESPFLAGFRSGHGFRQVCFQSLTALKNKR
jgi:transposase